MSDQENYEVTDEEDIVEEDVADEMVEDETEGEELDEFKASFGDPSSVPEPINKKAKKLKGSKDGGEKSPVVTPGSKPPSTKVAAINSMLQHMQGMSKADILGMHNSMVNEEDFIEDDAEELVPVKEVPHVSAEDLDLSDDVQAMFGDEELSEDFKKQATTVFTAAVVSKINETLDKISIQVDAEVEAERENIEKELTGKLDDYLDYVVQEWTTENEVAIEKGLRTEITEDFLKGLQTLFAEHYIDVPEDKVDVAEELAQKVEELEDTLNKEIEKNVELNKAISEHAIDDAVRSVGSDLSDVQKDKLQSLSSGIEFENESDFVEKLNVVKEQYFSTDSESLSSMVEDDSETTELEESSEPTGSMAVYLNAISRTVKK
jgi:hypothetical protein